MLANKRIDWTPYHDPIHANKISNDLEKLPFEKIADLYGKNFDNLVRYGFIRAKYLDELRELYHTYKPIKAELKFWKKEQLEDCQESKEAQLRKEGVEGAGKSCKRASKRLTTPTKTQN